MAMKAAATQSRSVRTSVPLWEAAKRKAAKEGLTINAAINEFLEGYATGKIALPKVVKIYPDQNTSDKK